MIRFDVPRSVPLAYIEDGVRAAMLRCARTRIQMREAGGRLDLVAYREAKVAHKKALEILKGWRDLVCVNQ